MDCLKCNDVKAFIEISKGSNLKYEFDKENQCLVLDRILHNSNVFPYNYGYVPNTLSDDGDPLDIIILCDYAIHPGTMVSCKIIGGIYTEDEKKGESKKLYSWWFMTFVNTVEYANAAFNPFDINLDGWGEQVNDDIDSYDEIFGELYEKYKGGKLSPEIALLLRLGFSAAVVNFTNRALSSATPGFNDVIRQSPELMKMFTNATVNSMSQQSPGFAFANNLVNPEPTGMSVNFPYPSQVLLLPVPDSLVAWPRLTLGSSSLDPNPNKLDKPLSILVSPGVKSWINETISS